jgi:hypothetical protein
MPARCLPVRPSVCLPACLSAAYPAYLPAAGVFVLHGSIHPYFLPTRLDRHPFVCGRSCTSIDLPIQVDFLPLSPDAHEAPALGGYGLASGRDPARGVGAAQGRGRALRVSTP